MISFAKKYLVPIVVLFLLFCTISVWYTLYHERSRELRFVMLDIGQGDALYIEAPNGNKVLVDGGGGDALLGQLSKVMPFFDRTIDLIINTNPDKDHFEGFIPLLDRYSVGAFMEPGVDADNNPLWQELLTKVKDKNITHVVARRGQRIELGDSVYIEILFPDRDAPALSHNDGSIVARLVYGQTAVLLTGDSTQNVEKYLVTLGKDQLKADILKVGHHGSKTSTSEELVQAVKPMVALISAGRGNMYGHPNQETLDTLSKYNVPYLVTMNEGSIEYDSDGTTFTRVK